MPDLPLSPDLPLLAVSAAAALACLLTAAAVLRPDAQDRLRRGVAVLLASAAAWSIAVWGPTPADDGLLAAVPLAAGWATVSALWFVTRVATDHAWRPPDGALWALWAGPQVALLALAATAGLPQIGATVASAGRSAHLFTGLEDLSYDRMAAGAVVLLALGRLSSARRSAPASGRRALQQMRVGATLVLVGTAATITEPDSITVVDVVPFAVAVAALLYADALGRDGFAVLVAPPLHRVLDTLRDAVVVLDRHDRVVDANDAARRMVAHGGDLLGTPVSALAGALPAARVGGPVVVVEHPRGVHREVRADALRDDDGRLLGTVITARDVTRLVLAQRALEDERRRLLRVNGEVVEALTSVAHERTELAEDAVRDALTGIHNRRHLQPALEAAVRGARASGTQLAVMVVDIDHFKRVNDTHGHPVGDRVLQAVAAELARSVRAEDTVVRYGGEEFVVVARVSSSVDALQRADALRRRLASMRIALRDADLVGPGAVQLTVTASIGVASYPAHGTTTAALVATADEALYAAKESGRDCVVMA